MRLQKFLARAGAASRRGSENLMTAGRVTVNGNVVTELGSKVDPLVDEVAVDGKVVRLADGPVTIMLHKPAGYVTTMSDPQGRPTVAELVPVSAHPGLFPVGRLDADTTGLLLFSTDGELGNGLLHPRRHVVKRYLACVEGRPSERELELLRQGVELDDGPSQPAEASVLEGADARRAMRVLDVPPVVAPNASRERADALRRRARERAYVRICVHEGRKRQVKRMLAAVGHPVVALHRDSFGPLDLGDLPRGAWRALSEREVAALHAATSRANLDERGALP
ncbi:pseudouridine synthase [Gordonibacter sp. An230]|uniref:pseudouridine synthase n=1 Tax=Gordonibacter sp. An230 TaxID=1965592 RepID=UPI000B369170|nr:pseudouridine synthase [Gordonibacter sp. An230]OUO90772.1 pseudouridine synthase [Gordonibacter sp. An230]